jgi:hypothetical protein
MENLNLQSDRVLIAAKIRTGSIAIRILIILAALSGFASAQARSAAGGLGVSCSAILDVDRSFGLCPLTLLAMNEAPQPGAPQTPIVSLSSTALDFGTVLFGTTTLGQKVTLTNTGNATLKIKTIQGSNPLDFALYKGCPASLAPGENCNFTIGFTPSTAGTLTGTISVRDNAPGSPHQVSLTGIGSMPTVQLSATSLDFGTVAVGSTGSTQTVSLTNASSNNLTNISVSSGSGEFAQTNDCPGSLAPSASCTIAVTFSPASGATRTANLTINDSDPSSPQLVGLTGTGASGSVSLSPASLAFPNQAIYSTSPAKSTTLTNTGSASLEIISILASGDFAQTNTCPASLGPGASCTINVTFTPSSIGARTGFVTLSDTDATNLQTLNNTGTGVSRRSTIAVKPRVASVNFTATQQFQALLNGVLTTDVTWAVDGITGGNGTVGTISTAGLYTPPAATGTHSVKATYLSDPTQFASVPIKITNFAGAFTYHYDNARIGLNSNETVLTTGNVNRNQFGKVFSYPVDGQLYAEPLYVPSVNLPGLGVHNVVYVATEHDSVYAFDADGLVSGPLWQTSFIDPVNGVTTIPPGDIFPVGFCSSIGPEVGITATPVIDSASGILYVLVRTKEVSGGVTSYPQRLHALDITTGGEVSGSPRLIQATIPGFGEGNVQGIISFDDIHHNSRAGLLLVNGVVYITWASPCDQHPYHGWVLGYDANTLQQVSVYNTSTNGDANSIWQGGAGVAADTSGNIYFFTGNGNFTADKGGTDYGDAIMKLSPNGGTLDVADYFVPYNQQDLLIEDSDLSGGGPLLLPDQPTPPAHLLVGAGKEGTVYLVDRDNMGHFSPYDNNRIQQTLPSAVGIKGHEDAFFGIPAYWQNHIYFWGANDVLKTFRLHNGLLSQKPISTASAISQVPGPVPMVSSNGNTHGIVWAMHHRANQSTILRAYDAANISRELYDSTQAGTRDQAGISVRFSVPTVANGRVYVGTQSELDVYGLLP